MTNEGGGPKRALVCTTAQGTKVDDAVASRRGREVFVESGGEKVWLRVLVVSSDWPRSARQLGVESFLTISKLQYDRANDLYIKLDFRVGRRTSDCNYKQTTTKSVSGSDRESNHERVSGPRRNTPE